MGKRKDDYIVFALIIWYNTYAGHRAAGTEDMRKGRNLKYEIYSDRHKDQLRGHRAFAGSPD